MALTLVLSVAATVVVLAGAAWLFTPLLGPARAGPMRGVRLPAGVMSAGMMRQMHGVGTVDSEFDFLTRMIPHHQEAVDSARELRERTERPEMRQFAETIIETQSREIEQMQEWLERWYFDRSREVDYEPMMGDYSGLSGDRLDRLFLEEMIPHHMAAVMMSQQLIRRSLAEYRQVENLAATIRDAQLQEIQQMSRWLERWFE